VRALGASVAEILDRASPIDIGEKPFITKAGALQELGRADVQDLFEGGLRAKLVVLCSVTALAASEKTTHAAATIDVFRLCFISGSGVRRSARPAQSHVRKTARRECCASELRRHRLFMSNRTDYVEGGKVGHQIGRSVPASG